MSQSGICPAVGAVENDHLIARIEDDITCGGGSLHIISRQICSDGTDLFEPAVRGHLYRQREQFPDRFSIIDFYLQTCHRAKIVGCVKNDLKMIDVGKLDSLDRAEKFLMEE